MLKDAMVKERIVDLSQVISPDMQVFPAYPKPCLLPWTRRETYEFEAEALFLATHTGTHVDPKGSKIDEVDVSKLIRPPVLFDLSGKKKTAPDDRLSLRSSGQRITSEAQGSPR